MLRNRRLLGLKFLRQHVLRGFIVDFYCAELHLVLELDGGDHDGAAQAGYDASRTAWLRANGYRVIRIANHDLTLDHLGQLIGEIGRRMDGSPTSPLSR